jgi:hypothetical protein
LWLRHADVAPACDLDAHPRATLAKASAMDQKLFVPLRAIDEAT